MDVQRLYEEDLRKSRELFEEELLLTKEIRDLEVCKNYIVLVIKII